MAATQKKMNVWQLTFIVTVNMMGSGIIMLPTNMAQVGAISLLSWLVTAVGSMAIAYGFAQAGIINQRAGGMAAYAEDAYGRDGYFQVFFLYFLSLAVANVAVASSALGYISAFFPVLTANPIATCMGVIALLWLTTAANFGGPKITGRIGAVTVWGVILPVGFISIFGWLWFNSDTFAQAWNPKGLSLFEGMHSSISLTLWAFLGMESAVQNSSAVENPKRDVPLASMFGTLGAAAIYILSTTVIQGVVPNAQLAESTGPFGLAFAQMFTPFVGQIVMGLAAMACVGSLLGWQFTLAQTAKDAADSRLFPAIFGKSNAMGAPIAGMVIMGIVQSLMALSTISPNLSEQFSALVNLAVVTNVVPYIVALSALFVMMRNAGTPQGQYRLNSVVAVIAMAYSIYALYAAGKDAVLGGMLVMAIGYVIFGFIAPRFTSMRAPTMSPTMAAAAMLVLAITYVFSPPSAHAADKPAALATAPTPAEPVAAPPPATSALDRIRQTGKITLGYGESYAPFTFRDGGGKVNGYTASLCQMVVEQIKSDLALPNLGVEWVAMRNAGDVQEHRVDLMCGSAVTLDARRQLSFSIPVYPGGVGALLRADASPQLKETLAEAGTRPLWRASPTQVLGQQTFAVIAGSPTETWAKSRVVKFKLSSRLVPVTSVQEGAQLVLQRKANVFFAEHALLQDVARANGKTLVVLERHFTFTPVALAMARGDEDLRLTTDRRLSHFFGSGEYRNLYKQWFGEADEDVQQFFRLTALPD